ncbi:MAG: hypothetical protein ABUK01_05865 [Leptospirales bacterium]
MKASSTLRRIAWAVGKQMMKTAEDIMDFLPQVIDKKLVCKRCRDKSKWKIAFSLAELIEITLF